MYCQLIACIGFTIINNIDLRLGLENMKKYICDYITFFFNFVISYVYRIVVSYNTYQLYYKE